MVTLYAFKGRSRAERVLWALRELELEHRVIRLDFAKGETGSEEFRSLNPSGKVPVVEHDGRVFTESVAIIQYLDALADKSIIPGDRLARYDYDHRVMYLLTEVEPYLWVADQASFLDQWYEWPDKTEQAARKILGVGLSPIASWLEGSRYLAGDVFTAADIVAYHLMTWAGLHGAQVSEPVAGYLARLERRPAFPEMMNTPGSPAVTG